MNEAKNSLIRELMDPPIGSTLRSRDRASRATLLWTGFTCNASCGRGARNRAGVTLHDTHNAYAFLSLLRLGAGCSLQRVASSADA